MTTGSFFSTNWIILLNEVVWHAVSCLPSIHQLTGAPFHPATLWSGLEGMMRGWMFSCLAKTTETDISSEFWLIKWVIIFAAACCLYWKSVYDFQYTLSFFSFFFNLFLLVGSQLLYAMPTFKSCVGFQPEQRLCFSSVISLFLFFMVFRWL